MAAVHNPDVSFGGQKPVSMYARVTSSGARLVVRTNRDTSVRIMMEKQAIALSLVVFEAQSDPTLPKAAGLVHYYQPTAKQADIKVVYEFVRLRKDACYIFQILTTDQFPVRTIRFSFEVLQEQDIVLQELKA